MRALLLKFKVIDESYFLGFFVRSFVRISRLMLKYYLASTQQIYVGSSIHYVHSISSKFNLHSDTKDCPMMNSNFLSATIVLLFNLDTNRHYIEVQSDQDIHLLFL